MKLFKQRDGRFTRERRQERGGFGLGQVPERLAPEATASVVCGFCSTGCSLDLHLRGGEAINLTPTPAAPVNLGAACPKGWEALTPLDSPDRATTPLLRSPGGELRPVDWSTAIDAFCGRFKSIQVRHGAESIAFLGTGQIPSEEMALLGSLFKFGMGGLHCDGNTRQCMATSVVAYKESFGFDAPPYTYGDFEESDVIVLVGANLCIAHPILWERVKRNPHNPEIIVIDPRRTETAMQATDHLAIHPKSDLELFYGLAHILVRQGWIDQGYIDAHTTGFDELVAHVRSFTPERVAVTTGIAAERLEALARKIGEGDRVSFWWTMGVNQSYQGVRTAQAIIDLALMTGNIGRPGTGANSITGQCNAMGSRLFSNTTSLLGGHDFQNEAHRTKIAALLGIDPGRIPNVNSLAYDQIVEGILQGKIHGLWVIATNPAHSWINQNHLQDVLDRLDFLVVQDMYDTTETAVRADLVLPAAGWGEKEGTFINSERRIGLVKKLRRAPGHALSDFAICKLIADGWGCREMFRKWSSPEAVFQILKGITAGQPCDITGIRDYRMMDEYGGIQWPFPAARAPRSWPSERRLFENGRFCHPNGRARFVCEEPRPMPEPPSEQYPFLLLTGRGSAAQWHTQTRTAKSPVLRKLYPNEVYVEVNPADGRSLGLRQNERVVVESRRGRIEATAFLTHSVRPGQVFLPMHYETVNQLSDSVFDPYSRQPNYKSCAVRVLRKPWREG